MLLRAVSRVLVWLVIRVQGLAQFVVSGLGVEGF